MPRAPRNPDEAQDYFILDPNATSVAGVDIPTDDKGNKADVIRLTPAQAAFGIANGVIGTENPEKSRHARRALEVNTGGQPTGEGDESEGRRRRRGASE